MFELAAPAACMAADGAGAVGQTVFTVFAGTKEKPVHNLLLLKPFLLVLKPFLLLLEEHGIAWQRQCQWPRQWHGLGPGHGHGHGHGMAWH